jgi:UDP-N-acetylglucosamine:LPS N-acetylglucosamine transferase
VEIKGGNAVSLDGSELVEPDLRAGLRPEIAVDRLEVVHEDHLAVIHEDRLEVIQEPPRLLAGSAILVGSSGGHLAQLLSIAPLWAKDKRSYVTFDTVDALSLLADEQVTWAHHPTTRNVRNLVRNTRLAFREVHRRRPDVVVSTGAAVAFPFFIAARLRGIPTVYVEVYDRIDSPTLTGRLCRPLSTLFCVQWPEQLEFYRGSKLVGSLM